MNIENIYYNKYLELKGGGIFGMSKEEEKLYGPALLEKIKSHISVAKDNISTSMKSYIKGKISGNVKTFDIYSIYNFELSIFNLLDDIIKIPDLVQLQEIKNAIVEIYPRQQGLSPYKDVKKLDEIKRRINEVFEKLNHKSKFPILKKFFDFYYQNIKKVQ